MDISNKLPIFKYKLADDNDLFINIDLKIKNKELFENNIVSILDIREQFDKERNSINNYRIYGNINYLSLINNKESVWDSITDLFAPENTDQNSINFNLYNTFDIYIIYPYEFEKIKDIDSNKALYIKKYKKISQINELSLIKCGFSKNVFSEDVFNFLFNKNYNFKDLTTKIGDTIIPIMDIGIFFELKSKVNNNFSYTNFRKNYSLNNYEVSTATTYGYNISNYDKINFNNTIITNLKPNDYGNSEFINDFFDKITLIFEFLNIELTSNNIIINSDFLKNYLLLDRGLFENITDIGDTIDGELMIFDIETYQFIPVEEQVHKFSNNFTISSNDTIQFIKESTYYVEDFQNWLQIKNNNSTYIIEIVDFNLKTTFNEVIFKVLSNNINITNNIINDFNIFKNEYDNYDSIKKNIFNKYMNHSLIDNNQFIKLQMTCNKIPVGTNLPIYFIYNPIITRKLRYFSDGLERGYSGNTDNIPSYAYDYKNGNYVWRDVLEIGFIEPESGFGVDYPFINGNHYLHNNDLFKVKSDNSNKITKRIFEDFENTIKINPYKNKNLTNRRNNKC